MDTIEAAMDLLMDPVAGSPSAGKYVVGVICLHVDDLLIIGSKELEGTVMSRLRQEFQVGSEGKTDVVFTGQHVKRLKDTIEVDQFRAIEELVEIEFDKALKDDVACTPALHTSYRSVLGSLNWLQSRTQYQICYRFSRCASAAASPTIADVRAINKLVRSCKSEPVKLVFHKLNHPCRILDFPDASYRNNADKSSQRGQVIFIAEQRKLESSAKAESSRSRLASISEAPRSRPAKSDLPVGAARGSLVDYESQKIHRTTLSTTVSELYSFMKAYGTALFIKGLWCDISGERCDIHMRTDANNLVTTASTTHLPEQKETIHMIAMLRKEACSGYIDDLAHIRTQFCLADALTKYSAKCDTLVTAVTTGILPEVDVHPPFRSLLHHKAYLAKWLSRNIAGARGITWFLGEYVNDAINNQMVKPV